MMILHPSLLAAAALVAAAAAAPAVAQHTVPVEELGVERAQAVQRGQFKAGNAYRDWQQSQYDAKLAEQDVLNLEDAYRRSSAETAELKRRLDAAKQALAHARAAEAKRREAYEQAVEAVDRARGDPPGAK